MKDAAGQALTTNFAQPIADTQKTVAGERGSTQTPRDVRGFATKFYTEDPRV